MIIIVRAVSCSFQYLVFFVFSTVPIILIEGLEAYAAIKQHASANLENLRIELCIFFPFLALFSPE